MRLQCGVAHGMRCCCSELTLNDEKGDETNKHERKILGAPTQSKDFAPYLVFGKNLTLVKRTTSWSINDDVVICD